MRPLPTITKIRRLLHILTILTLICSCEHEGRTKTIEGDLYFKLIDLQKLFNAPDSTLIKLEQAVKKVKKDTLSESDKKIYPFLKYMVDNDLLRKPFIRIRLDNGDIKMLFLEQSDYTKFDSYRLFDLRGTNKKIRIKAQVTEMQHDTLTAYNIVKLLSVDTLDGKTEFKK